MLIVHLKWQADSPLRLLTSWRPLVSLGKISYGVYLWHFVVMVWMQPIVQQKAYRRFGWEMSLFIGGGLSILIAVFSYRLIEVTFLRLKSRFK